MDTSIEVAIVTGLFGIITPVTLWYLNSKKREKKESLLPKLIDHHIFMRIEMLKNHIDVNFTLPNKGKELLFKNLLLSNLDVWQVNLKEFAGVLDESCERMDPMTFQNTVLNYFSKGISEFSDYYKRQGYTYDERVGLDLVMAKFNKWNYPRVNSFRDTLLIVCNSQFYLDHRVKSAVIMDMYISLFVDTIGDAETTIGEINGDLKGMTFKGVTI